MATDGPDLLSASSVNTFLRCGRSWFYAYVAGIKSPPTVRLLRGIAVHKAVETNMAQKIESKTDVPLDVVMDAYDDSWNTEAEGGLLIDDDAKESPGEAKDKGYQLVELHHKKVAPNIQPVWVEQPVQFTLNGIPFTGQIDLAHEVPNLDPDPEAEAMGLEIVDTKTTARKPAGESYLLNMTGYALASRQITGKKESNTRLDYLVAVKEPYYLPVSAGGPTSDAQIERFANVVESVAGAIQAGQFIPNGLIGSPPACSWCSYRNICPAYLKKDVMA
jgi:RecB family exonuclease